MASPGGFADFMLFPEAFIRDIYSAGCKISWHPAGQVERLLLHSGNML